MLHKKSSVTPAQKYLDNNNAIHSMKKEKSWKNGVKTFPVECGIVWWQIDKGIYDGEKSSDPSVFPGQLLPAVGAVVWE